MYKYFWPYIMTVKVFMVMIDPDFFFFFFAIKVTYPDFYKWGGYKEREGLKINIYYGADKSSIWGKMVIILYIFVYGMKMLCIYRPLSLLSWPFDLSTSVSSCCGKKKNKQNNLTTTKKPKQTNK